MAIKLPSYKYISDPPERAANADLSRVYGVQDAVSRSQRALTRRVADNIKVYTNQYDLKAGSNLVTFKAPFKPRGRRIVYQSADATLYGDKFGKTQWQVNCTADCTFIVAWER